MINEYLLYKQSNSAHDVSELYIYKLGMIPWHRWTVLSCRVIIGQVSPAWMKHIRVSLMIQLSEIREIHIISHFT